MNHPDPVTRQALLAAAARHVAADGAAYIEHYDTAHVATDRDGHVGPVQVSLRILERDGTWYGARASYLLDGRSWSQTFEAELLTTTRSTRSCSAPGFSGTAGSVTPG